MHRRRFRRLELGLHDIRIAGFIRALLISVFSVFASAIFSFHAVWKRFVGRTRVANRCRATLIRHCYRIQHGELGRQFLVGVVGVPSGIGADFAGSPLLSLLRLSSTLINGNPSTRKPGSGPPSARRTFLQRLAIGLG